MWRSLSGLVGELINVQALLSMSHPPALLLVKCELICKGPDYTRHTLLDTQRVVRFAAYLARYPSCSAILRLSSRL